MLALALAAATCAGAVAPRAEAAAVAEPHEDPFYVPDPGFESAAPGTVLRSRVVQATGLRIPLPVDATQALVRSTDAHGRPMAIVTTLLVPRTPLLATRRPLLSYQPAIDSLGDQCQPSYTLRTGTLAEIPVFLPTLLRGWAVVVSDYQGPLNAYGAGRLEGQATLDGIRAALALGGTGLRGLDTPVGMWGYSGGALATGWAAELAPTYAPELHLVGAATGGTPSDLQAAGHQIDGGPASGLFLSAAIGVSREYPEILDLLNDAGRQLVEDIGDTCVAQASAGYPFRSLADYSTSATPLEEPVAEAVLDANHMGTSAPTIPMYVYHSYFDELIPYATARQLRSDWCAGGTPVQFSTDYVSEHISLVATGSTAAIAYLANRFAGRPPNSNCPT